MIEKIRRTSRGRNISTVYKDLVWTVATALDESLDLVGQTSQTLSMIESNLTELGSDKFRIILAQVYLSNTDDKSAMNEVWNE